MRFPRTRIAKSRIPHFFLFFSMGGISRSSLLPLLSTFLQPHLQPLTPPSTTGTHFRIEMVCETSSFSFIYLFIYLFIFLHIYFSFIVVWTGAIQSLTSGTYSIDFLADDGVRVYVAGVLVVDSWDSSNVSSCLLHHYSLHFLTTFPP